MSPQVLVPRPESEAIIELLKELGVSGKLLDIGTGSGCLGITAKLEIPKLNVILSDIIQPALRVARQNAEKFQADVALIKSNLLRAVPGKFDIIIANLPYVDRSWQRSPETNHEPALALFAKDEGLALIYQLIYLIFILVLIIALFNLVKAIIMMILDKKSEVKSPPKKAVVLFE